MKRHRSVYGILALCLVLSLSVNSAVDNLGAYSIPSETGLLIPSDCRSCRWSTFRVMQEKSRPRPSQA
jgi:hypothetical protein